MRLDELLPEMVEMICDYLSLRDRQALAATSSRMEELVMHPRFLKTITLRLNRVTRCPNEYGYMGDKNDVIPKDIVEGSSRDYKNVKIELCAGLELGWACELFELFEARETPVKHLEVTDQNCLQVMRLYHTCQSVFNQIETLDVQQWGKIRGSIPTRHLVLPELRQLFWHESPDFEEAMHPQANMDITLSAPLLEHATISMPTTWDDVLSLAGRYYMPHLHVTKHPKLRSLSLFVDERTVQTLSQTLHPALVNLTLHFPPLQIEGSCLFGLVHNVPNLRVLELAPRKRTSAAVMTQIFLEENASIRTLTLQDFVLERTVCVSSLFSSIQHLHIHESEVQLRSSSVTMELPALKTFCLRADVVQARHTLKLHLPNVREMAVFYRGKMVDVLSAPRLEELRLHYTCRPSLPFLDFPLLHLNTLVLQIDNDWSMLNELLTLKAPALRHLTIICHVPHCIEEILEQIDRQFPQLDMMTIYGL